jgi:hypothetical protein
MSRVERSEAAALQKAHKGASAGKRSLSRLKRSSFKGNQTAQSPRKGGNSYLVKARLRILLPCHFCQHCGGDGLD